MRKIIRNTQPALRLLAVAHDPATGATTCHDWPIVAWFLMPGRFSEPITVQPLKGLDYAVLDTGTGAAMIPGGATFATATEAWEGLTRLAMARGREGEKR